MSGRPRDDEAIAGFVHKWQAREPGMALAELFVAKAQRPRFRAWGALLHALREAAFELSDAGVRAAKSAWWAQELVAMAQGRPSHPIGVALLPLPTAPWQALAAALLEAASAEASAPVDGEHAVCQLRPLAEAIAAVETQVFACVDTPYGAESIAVHLLAQRLLVGQAADDAGRIPLHLLARHQLGRSAIREGGAGVAARDWARELLQREPARLFAAAPFRRMCWAQDRALLARLASGAPQPARPGLCDLWRIWRAAQS